MSFSHASKNRLTPRDLDRFSSHALFDRIARAVCEAGCLPRKELYEAWEVARRVRRLFRGRRVVDVAGGHGLLAHVMLILDATSRDARVIDPSRPPSSARVAAALIDAWPRLAGRVEYRERTFDGTELDPDDIVVSNHACGPLTDVVLDAAVQAGARVAVLPCCHDPETCETGELTGWVDAPMAIDLVRAARLRAAGYRVWTQTIPKAITPKNRLLIGEPGLKSMDETSRTRYERA